MPAAGDLWVTTSVEYFPIHPPGLGEKEFIAPHPLYHNYGLPAGIQFGVPSDLQEECELFPAPSLGGHEATCPWHGRPFPMTLWSLEPYRNGAEGVQGQSGTVPEAVRPAKALRALAHRMVLGKYDC